MHTPNRIPSEDEALATRFDQVAVHEDELVSLVGRAQARRRFPELEFDDPWAEQVLAQLDLGLRAQDFDERRLRAATMRTKAIDGIVRHFFERHPDGLAVSLYAGLCTRFSRVDNGALRFIDLDPPAIAKFKCMLLRTPDRHTVAACCSLTCNGWMSLLGDAGEMPVLLLGEGMLLRRPHDEIDAFLTTGAQRFARGVELVLDYDARAPVRPSTLDEARACLEIPERNAAPGPETGNVARYPSLKYFPRDLYPAELARELSGLNGAASLFRGRGVSSIAHLRFA